MSKNAFNLHKYDVYFEDASFIVRDFLKDKDLNA